MSRPKLSHGIPWKTLTHSVIPQICALLITLAAIGVLTRSYFKYAFLSHAQGLSSPLDPSSTLRLFDTSLALLFAAFGLVLVISGCLLAKKLVFPMGRKLFLESRIENLKTEREEQATLMSAISDAILAVDQEEAPLFYNSRFALLFGDQKLHNDQRLWEIFRDPEILAAFHEALKSGKSSSVKAIPMDDATDRRFFSLSVSPLKQAENYIYGAVGVFHDVTDLKRAEQIRIDFVANVSHELRTPLTAIKGYADTLLLDSKQGTPVVPEFLEVIVRNTDRLMNLINDLLDLSSLESKDTLQKVKMSTEEVTSRILKQMKCAFETKNQRVSLENHAPYVLADPRRLEQVLVNLLDNANKYTPTDGRICIQWDPTLDKNTLLTVRNTGSGIPPEHHSRLFERFYRVDKARSREQGGTGLGLAIVKHIMQRHDGSVWVESKPGQDTAFLCRFPG